MIRKILFFILFTIGLNVQAQDHGILIKTTIRSSAGWSYHGGEHRIIIGQNEIVKHTNPNAYSVVEFDYFTITDNPSEILKQSFTAGSRDREDCSRPTGAHHGLYSSTAYNKDTFRQTTYLGCFADSFIMSIHIPEPTEANAQICSKDIVELINGWNWRYSFDGVNWPEFPAKYQNQNTISFMLTDLPGYNNTHKTIHFQPGYNKTFTNTVTYSIVGCSPELDGNPTTSNTKCNDDPSGSVSLKFKSELKAGEKFLFTLFLNGTQPISSTFAQKNEIINGSYTWRNIKEGNYTIRYQSQNITDNGTTFGSSMIDTPAFTIGSPAPLKFTTTAVQPLCSTDKGTIQISASGGTPPYYYSLDNESQKHVFTSPYSITGLSEGDHSVKVVDSNNCVEK